MGDCCNLLDIPDGYLAAPLQDVGSHDTQGARQDTMRDRGVWARVDEVVGVVWSAESKVTLRLAFPVLCQRGAVSSDQIPRWSKAHIKPGGCDDQIILLFTICRLDALLGNLGDRGPDGFGVFLLQGLEVAVARGQTTAAYFELWLEALDQLGVVPDPPLHGFPDARIKRLLLGSSVKRRQEVLVKHARVVKLELLYQEGL